MRKILLLLVLLLSICPGYAQQKDYWHAVNEADVNKSALWAGKFKPAAYKMFRLNVPALAKELEGVLPEERLYAGLSKNIISIPDAEGVLHRFRVAASSLMQPGLAAKYPAIKTFSAKGIDDPYAVMRFSITPYGFNAMITSTGKPTYYINTLDAKNSICAVNARNNQDHAAAFKCSLDDAAIHKGGITGRITTLTGNADDGMLRQYRLALCVNGEFSQTFLDGTEADTDAMKAKVLSALIVCLERANMIYERDFGIRLIFPDKEDTLIFIDPVTDPWKASTANWNAKTQQTINKNLGAANYDIGHLLGKVSDSAYNNGNAHCIGCVCNDSQKGSGYTAYYDPTLTDYLVIDYWTHEMGHQFGANHTFTFSTEGTEAQIEPGSGSTIMGYAGITGATDVQAHSDDLFSIVSIAQNTTYIKSDSGSCSINMPTGNHAPVVKAGHDFTIPKSTAFVLTGTASDADSSDSLSFIWEQVDVFESATSNTIPTPTAKTGPLVRTYNYTASPKRYIPDLATVLNGHLSTEWEVLAAKSREMNFRFTARDNHAGGGSNKSDNAKITVTANAGPFAITTQNTPNIATWHANEIKTITWDVANTNTAPVSCSKVNILLSLDGGLSFPVVLASATANDGTEDVEVPNLSTEHARIKIEAASNIFFTISDADFEVASTLPVTWLSFTAQKLNNATVLLSWSTVNELRNKDFRVQRSSDGVNFSQVMEVAATNAATSIQQYKVTDYKALAGANYYRLQQMNLDGSSSFSAIAKVIMPQNAVTWSIQPNPAKTTVSLYASKTLTNVSIALINTVGKTVYLEQRSKISAGETILIPVNNLAAAMYFIKVSSAEEQRTEKFSVE